jgi:hypothetical protein
MSFNFLKAENQLLEKSLQIPPPNFFRNQFLDTIARNQFLLKKNQSIQTGHDNEDHTHESCPISYVV